MDDGNMMQVDGTKLLDNPLPRPLRIVRVQFKIQKGVLYYYNHLEFAGLETIGEKQARAYYIESGALFILRVHAFIRPNGKRMGTPVSATHWIGKVIAMSSSKRMS